MEANGCKWEEDWEGGHSGRPLLPAGAQGLLPYFLGIRRRLPDFLFCHSGPLRGLTGGPGYSTRGKTE